MSAHTPGPWVDLSGGAPKRPIDIISKGLNIATVKGSSAYNVPESYGERIANARLIAAAPELLEILKEVRRERLAPGSPLYKRVTEIIDKAEGK